MSSQINRLHSGSPFCAWAYVVASARSLRPLLIQHCNNGQKIFRLRLKMLSTKQTKQTVNCVLRERKIFSLQAGDEISWLKTGHNTKIENCKTIEKNEKHTDAKATPPLLLSLSSSLLLFSTAMLCLEWEVRTQNYFMFNLGVFELHEGEVFFDFFYSKVGNWVIEALHLHLFI